MTTLAQSMQEAWIVRAEEAIFLMDAIDKASALFKPETRDLALVDYWHAKGEIARWSA